MSEEMAEVEEIEIVEEIENVGGDLNAETTAESTAYFARVMQDDLPLAFDILADIVANPAFEATELEREKDVILQEIASIEDNPEELVFDLFMQQAFPDHAIGRPQLHADHRGWEKCGAGQRAPVSDGGHGRDRSGNRGPAQDAGASAERHGHALL